MDNIIDYKKIGQRIKLARNKKGITQEKLCNDLNISIFHYSKIENAHVSATLDTLAEIGKYLDIPLDFLIAGVSTIEKEYLDDELATIFKSCSKPQQQMIIEMAKVISKSEIKSVSFKK